MLFALAQWMLTINLDEQIDTQRANHLLKVTQLVSDFEPLSTAPILVLGTRRKGISVPSHGLLSKLELKFGKPDCHRLVPMPLCLLKSQPTPGPAPSVCCKNKIYMCQLSQSYSYAPLHQEIGQGKLCTLKPLPLSDTIPSPWSLIHVVGPPPHLTTFLSCRMAWEAPWFPFHPMSIPHPEVF